MSHLTKQRTYTTTAPAVRIPPPGGEGAPSEGEGRLSGATTVLTPTPAHSIRIMTGARARDGDVIDPLGMETARFMQNPVVLWMHGASGSAGSSGGIPIGRTLALRRDTDGIEADFEFLAGDPFAERVRNAWERGFIHAASVAWLTHEAVPMPHLDGSLRGLRHTRTELLEWSLVPVPADPGAHREVYAAGLRALGFEDLVAAPSEEARQASPLRELVRAADELREALAAAR